MAQPDPRPRRRISEEEHRPPPPVVGGRERPLRSVPARAEGPSWQDEVWVRVTQAVDYLFYLLYGLLGIRLLLSLMGAREGAGFVQLVHTLTQPFYAPFENIVARPALNGAVLDFPVVLAILAYMLLHVAVRGLFRVIAGRRV